MRDLDGVLAYGKDLHNDWNALNENNINLNSRLELKNDRSRVYSPA